MGFRILTVHIIGLRLASLKKLGYADRARLVWLGAGSAVILSLAVAVGLTTAGAELALFMAAAAVAGSAQWTWIGGLLGVTLAAAAGYALFASTARLDVRRFFQVTGLILLVFAAGLVARGVHEFVRIGWLPALMDPVWNTTSALNDRSALGQVAGSLLGYRSSPSLAKVISYMGYLAIVVILSWWTGRVPSHATQRA